MIKHITTIVVKVSAFELEDSMVNLSCQLLKPGIEKQDGSIHWASSSLIHYSLPDNFSRMIERNLGRIMRISSYGITDVPGINAGLSQWHNLEVLTDGVWRSA